MLRTPQDESAPRHSGMIDSSERGRELQRVREQGYLGNLTSTREYLNLHALQSAESLVEVSTGALDPSNAQLKAIVDVLDRTIGKAPTEVRLGMADLATDIIKEMATRDAVQGMPQLSTEAGGVE